jgi:hypothetical protein
MPPDVPAAPAANAALALTRTMLLPISNRQRDRVLISDTRTKARTVNREPRV